MYDEIKILTKFDAVHIVSFGMINIPIMTLCNILYIKSIIHIHRFDYEFYSLPKRVMLYIYNNLVLKYSTRIIVHSKKYFKLNKKVFYTELPFHKFNNILKDINPQKYLLFGRLAYNKGVDIFLEIAKRCPETKFVLAGKIVDNRTKKIINTYKNLKNVEFVLYEQKKEDLPYLFKNIRYLILPYKSATQSGLPYLSFALKTPIIYNNVGGLSDIIIDGVHGIKINNNHIQQYIKAINNTEQELFLKHQINCFKRINSQAQNYKYIYE